MLEEWEQNGKRINYDRIKELYSNIVKNGVWLAGGGSLLRGIAKRFAAKVNIPFHVAEDPLKAVARGTCLALKGSDRYPFMMK